MAISNSAREILDFSIQMYLLGRVTNAHSVVALTDFAHVGVASLLVNLHCTYCYTRTPNKMERGFVHNRIGIIKVTTE